MHEKPHTRHAARIQSEFSRGTNRPSSKVRDAGAIAKRNGELAQKRKEFSEKIEKALRFVDDNCGVTLDQICDHIGLLGQIRDVGRALRRCADNCLLDICKQKEVSGDFGTRENFYFSYLPRTDDESDDEPEPQQVHESLWAESILHVRSGFANVNAASNGRKTTTAR